MIEAAFSGGFADGFAVAAVAEAMAQAAALAALPVLSMSGLAAALRAGVPELIEVGTARDLGRVKAEAIRWPSAWVVPLAEEAGPNRYLTCHLTDQEVRARFGVVLAVRDIGDRTGARALTGIETIRPQVLLALGRHRPAGASAPCLHAGGRLVSGIGEDGSMIWQDDFTVTIDRRIAAPEEA